VRRPHGAQLWIAPARRARGASRQLL